MIRRLLLLCTGVLAVLLLAAAAGMYWLLAGDGVRVALERQSSAWLGAPVHIAVARPQLLPRPGLHLERIDVGDPVRMTLGTIDVSSDGRALLLRRIENASIVVANSRLVMPVPFSIPSAPQRSTETAGAPGVIRLVSVRSIELRNVVLASHGRELTVSAESSLSGTRLTLRQFTARTGATALEASGEVDLAPRVEARLRVKANRLDVDELLALAAAFAPPAGRSARSSSLPVRIAARVSSETASAAGVTVRQFATDLEADGSRVSLAPVSFQLFGGRYQGSVSAVLGEAFVATVRARVQDLDVAQLAEFGGAPGSVAGRLTGAGTFTGSGTDLGAALTAARGEGTASIMNGSIRRLNLVRTVVLFFGRPAPDTAPATDAFQRLDARFTVANQVLTAQALSLRSADADIVGSGTLALNTKKLDGHLDLSLSEELSAQAGRDLYRYTREGNRVVLPANIGGTLDAPRISIDAAAAVQRGLRIEIERRLGGILDRFKRTP